MLVKSILNSFELMSENLKTMRDLYFSFNMIDKFKEIISKYYNIIVQNLNLTDEEVSYLLSLHYDEDYIITDNLEMNDTLKKLIDLNIIVPVENKYYLFNLIVYNLFKMYFDLKDTVGTDKSEPELVVNDDIDVDEILLQKVRENLEEMKKKKREKIIEDNKQGIKLTEEDLKYQNIDYDSELDEETRKIFEEIESQ